MPVPSSPPSRMVLLRHTETSWSRSGRHTGRTDLPLEPPGRDQAVAAGDQLRSWVFGLVLVSPLERARETCRLAGFDGAEPDHDLAEWDYGDYEGKTTSEIRAERPGWMLFTDGVPHGETVDDVGRRVDRVIGRARAVGADTLCVSHGHLLRVLGARWLGLPPAAGRMFVLGTGSLSVLGWERETPVVEHWNRVPSPLGGPAWG